MSTNLPPDLHALMAAHHADMAQQGSAAPAGPGAAEMAMMPQQAQGPADLGMMPPQPGMGLPPAMMPPGPADPNMGGMPDLAAMGPDVPGGMGMGGMPGAVDALAGMLDSTAAQELMRKQEEERRMLAEQMKQELAAAAQVLMDRARSMGESVDQPGGPIGGSATAAPSQMPPMSPSGDAGGYA